MKEQSHKHEMAAALRGDFARLRARSVEAMRGARPESAAEQVEPAVEPPPAASEPASSRTGLSRFLRRS